MSGSPSRCTEGTPELGEGGVIQAVHQPVAQMQIHEPGCQGHGGLPPSESVSLALNLTNMSSCLLNILQEAFPTAGLLSWLNIRLEGERNGLRGKDPQLPAAVA